MQILAIFGAVVVFLICLGVLMWSVGLLEVGFDVDIENEGE